MLMTAPALYDPEPRRTSMLAAIKNRWAVDVIHIEPDGERAKETVYPTGVDGLLTKGRCDEGTKIRYLRLDRIEKLNVHAVRADARRRYRI